MPKPIEITLISHDGSNSRKWLADPSKSVMCPSSRLVSFTGSDGKEVDIFLFGQFGSVLVVEKASKN